MIYNLTKEEFLRDQAFTSWEALLRFVFTRLAGRNRVPVIIDEFPYLCMSNPALPSILQKVWDSVSAENSPFLIISGSYISFMEKEILSSKSPLFGRRTAQIFLKPLPFKEAKHFLTRYSKEDLVYAYSILGGVPAYLEKFEDRLTIEENVKGNILCKNAFLYEEPRFLLMEELREPSLYFAILKAIAFGKTKLNEIVQTTGISPAQKVNKYLTVLRELGLVKRELPVTEKKTV